MSGARIDGGTLYVADAQLAEALDRAAPGAQFIYATGPGLDPAHPTVALVRGLVNAGQARSQIAGRDGNGQLRHVVIKCAAKAGETPGGSAAKAGGARLNLPAEFMESVTGRVLALLTRQAEAGLPCPSDQAIAHALGLSGRGAAQYQIALLVGLNLIEVTNPSPRTRVVRINTTGRRTALPVGGV